MVTRFQGTTFTLLHSKSIRNGSRKTRTKRSKCNLIGATTPSDPLEHSGISRVVGLSSGRPERASKELQASRIDRRTGRWLITISGFRRSVERNQDPPL
jgi:hypothetical protein